MKYLEPLVEGKTYKVYRNLNKKCWSFRDDKNHVVAYRTDEFFLENVDFTVSEKGRERVREKKQKAVHAYAKGKFRETKPFFGGETARLQVTYDPYEDEYFQLHEADDSNTWNIHSASLVEFRPSGRIFAIEAVPEA